MLLFSAERVCGVKKYASGIFLAENRSQLCWQGSLTEEDMLKVIARQSGPALARAKTYFLHQTSSKEYNAFKLMTLPFGGGKKTVVIATSLASPSSDVFFFVKNDSALPQRNCNIFMNPIAFLIGLG
ncbi:MAG: hypothetical protein LUG55_07385 [Clostridiales bacterium]|nr:hypothetical protein [Clostridiales bacterium]